MREKVSVIIPTYNRAKWLLEAVESVLNQTYIDIEIVVVNDGSTDDTESALKPYMNNIVYIYKENGGPGTAVNAGLKASTGNYIARLDDDDMFMPEKIELQVEMLQDNPELGIVASDHYIIDENSEILDIKIVPDFSKHGAFLTMLQRSLFPQPTVTVRRECHDHVGLYKNTYAQDYDMWLRIARRYPVGVIHKPLAMYRVHSYNRSSTSKGDKAESDIRNFVAEIMDDTPLEELIDGLRLEPYGHDVKGAIFLNHCLYKKAGQEFYKALKSDPENAIHLFWCGILFRRLERYQGSGEYFSKIPSDHELHDDVLRAIEFNHRLQIIDREDEAAMIEFRRDTSEEYNKLLDMTIALAKGEL
jgi:glycosyltransferase involved in cell wall biosynthesis